MRSVLLIDLSVAEKFASDSRDDDFAGCRLLILNPAVSRREHANNEGSIRRARTAILQPRDRFRQRRGQPQERQHSVARVDIRRAGRGSDRPRRWVLHEREEWKPKAETASRVRFTTVRPEGRAKNDYNPHFSRARIRFIESESRAEAKIISVACARPIMCTRLISVHRFRGRHREPQRSSLPQMAANTIMGVVVRSIAGVDRPFATTPHAGQAPRQVTRVKTLIHVTPDEPAVGYFSLIMACIDTQFPFACAMRTRLGKSRSMRRRGK